MLDVYGLKNCDTCRKALKWLDAHNVTYRFHDLRADPPENSVVAAWLAALGADLLVNRRGTTWRGLPESDKQSMPEGALSLVMAHRALIKRPVIVANGVVSVGFTEEVRERLGA